MLDDRRVHMQKDNKLFEPNGKVCDHDSGCIGVLNCIDMEIYNLYFWLQDLGLVSQKIFNSTLT